MEIKNFIEIEDYSYDPLLNFELDLVTIAEIYPDGDEDISLEDSPLRERVG